MTQLSGTGPQKRLSSDSPRLSPIMKYSPGGTLIDCGNVQVPPGPQGAMYESCSATPLRITLPPEIEIVSPGMPTTRLMKVCLDSAAVGLSHGCGCPAPWLPSPQIA